MCNLYILVLKDYITVYNPCSKINIIAVSESFKLHSEILSPPNFNAIYDLLPAIGGQWYIEILFRQFSIMTTYLRVYAKLSELHFNVSLSSNRGKKVLNSIKMLFTQDLRGQLMEHSHVFRVFWQLKNGPIALNRYKFCLLTFYFHYKNCKYLNPGNGKGNCRVMDYLGHKQLKKNPAYGRHWISWRVQIIAWFLFPIRARLRLLPRAKTACN